MKKQHLTLTDTDRASLEAVLNQKIQRSRVFKRATALLELDRGRTLEAVSQTVGVSYQSVSAWRDKYRLGGLEAVLQEAPRPGRPIVIDGEQRAKITALACSRPPKGHARWSLRLLADKVVELDVCESISATHVRTILKKTTSAHTSKKRGASAK